MKVLLNRLYDFQKLTKDEAYDILIKIGKGEFANSQIASFLTVFNLRGVTVEELEGFREAMLEMCVKINFSDFNTIDIVGTGGDGKDTFNISTLASFVCAGAGLKVAKHGNYGVSSSSGSSNVLEHLGVPFTNEESKLKKMLDQSGFCMMHAPLFHPAMKHVGSTRKEMQVRTIFNMLGPIVNPSSPKNQLLGVFNLELLRLYGYLFQESNRNFKVVYAIDGYDEVSLTSPAKIIGNNGDEFLEPAHFGFETIDQSAISGGGSVKSAAQIFTSVLENKATKAQKSVVVANAALAIQTVYPNKNLNEAVSLATESIDSGKALKVLKTLQNFS